MLRVVDPCRRAKPGRPCHEGTSQFLPGVSILRRRSEGPPSVNTIAHSSRYTPIWLLVLITVSGTLAMHMFVPALPDAALSLGASAGAMQQTISVYIIGLACGQLVYGPMSDSLGRRPMLLIGLGLYTVAGCLALCSHSLTTLIVARLFQALGGCAGLALGRAIARDISESNDAVRTLALLNLMMMIGPGFAPLIGSGLVALGGWRAVFMLLTLLGAVTFVLTWRLIPETGEPTGKISVKILARDYGVLLRTPSFLGYAIGGGCATTSIYSFIAAAPFIVTRQLHQPLHDVGVYLGLLIAGMAVGNAITRRLVATVPIRRFLVVGNGASIVSGMVLLGVVLTGHLSGPMAVLLMFIFALGAGVASPAALSKSLGVNPHLIGSASGLYGFTQMSIGAFCTFLTGFGSNPALTAAWILVIASIVAQTAFWLGLQRERRRADLG